MDYPAAVRAYLLNRSVRHLHPAYFLLDGSGCIIRWGGAVDHFRIQEPRRCMPISELFTFAEGMVPMIKAEMVIECVELPGGRVADVHFFDADGGLWLLLLDAGEKADNQRLLQQKANELALLHDAHARILDQHLGKGMAQRLLNIDVQKGAERRILAVLFADIRGFTTFCEHRPPTEVFNMLNAYLTAMIQPILDGGGIVDKIIGDAVMAVFGILPSGMPAAVLAVDVAAEILKNTAVLAADRQRAGQPVLGVGVGIATGPVVMGILGSKDRRTLSVTGHSVNLAARLESRASAGEMLIDETTFEALKQDRVDFALRVLDLKGMDSLINAYGWMTQHGY